MARRPSRVLSPTPPPDAPLFPSPHFSPAGPHPHGVFVQRTLPVRGSAQSAYVSVSACPNCSRISGFASANSLAQSPSFPCFPRGRSLHPSANAYFMFSNGDGARWSGWKTNNATEQREHDLLGESCDLHYRDATTVSAIGRRFRCELRPTVPVDGARHRYVELKAARAVRTECATDRG